MTETPIRVGVVGAGANTVQRHIPGLRALPGVEIAGVVNRSRASSERAAAQLGIPKAYAHWTELVADPQIDAVVIGTWPYMHCPVTLAALEAGKHVLCEARMAMDAHEARLMRDAARARPYLVAQVVPSPYTLGVDRTIRRLLADGFLGEPLAVTVRDASGFLDRDSPLHWRQNADLSGMNIMSLGIWYEALMRWVGVAVRVSAMGRTFVRMRRDEAGALREVRVPEHLDVLGELACGAQLHMQISRVAGLAGPEEVRLYGSEGTLRFSGGALWGGRRGDTELRPIAVPPEEAGGWRVEEEFVGAIRGREPVTHTTFDDGVKYMEFTEAVARSIASGCAVTIPL
ncbi:MAG TPA: Gfo/Idh/MocA family oxidoreductase [Roseiflexaceae bacterium]|nr:Gfo/Idh/MocA family oxidoreductase [Roseiflexaceae bacterium]